MVVYLLITLERNKSNIGWGFWSEVPNWTWNLLWKDVCVGLLFSLCCLQCLFSHFSSAERIFIYLFINILYLYKYKTNEMIEGFKFPTGLPRCISSARSWQQGSSGSYIAVEGKREITFLFLFGGSELGLCLVGLHLVWLGKMNGGMGKKLS